MLWLDTARLKTAPRASDPLQIQVPIGSSGICELTPFGRRLVGLNQRVDRVGGTPGLRLVHRSTIGNPELRRAWIVGQADRLARVPGPSAEVAVVVRAALDADDVYIGRQLNGWLPRSCHARSL